MEQKILVGIFTSHIDNIQSMNGENDDTHMTDTEEPTILSFERRTNFSEFVNQIRKSIAVLAERIIVKIESVDGIFITENTFYLPEYKCDLRECFNPIFVTYK
jgi:hypothetical protein